MINLTITNHMSELTSADFTHIAPVETAHNIVPLTRPSLVSVHLNTVTTILKNICQSQENECFKLYNISIKVI